MELRVEFVTNPVSGETLIYVHSAGKQSLILSDERVIQVLEELKDFVENESP